MAESTSSKSLLSPIIEENHLVNSEDKSMKRKHNDIEEMESNAVRLLYNDTPEEEIDSVKSSTPIKKVKPPPFSKVWSNQDEISILKGLIKFKDETGRDAGHHMAEFRAFILESLTLQATLMQLREKVRRLKDKYEKNVDRGNEARTPHEVEVFQLCQKIWTEQPQQQNIPVNDKHTIREKGLPIKEKPNIIEIGQPNIPGIDEARQLMVDKHKIIPATGVKWETLNALWKPLSDDMELVVNSKPCLSGNKKEVESRVINLSFQSTNLMIKLGKLVLEKSGSTELGDFPEVLEQEVLRVYLEAKIEHTQLLLNAYNSFSKNHTDEGQSSMSAINK